LNRKHPEKTTFVCASGITPSGKVHFGNFREFITIEILARALRATGVSVRHIHIWDDFDAFRKIPPYVNALYEEHLRKPLDGIPSPVTGYNSYAEAHEKPVEQILQGVGVHPEYIYQSAYYRQSTYAELIRVALQHRAQLREILNRYRTTDLPEDWWPITVYSEFSEKDTTEIVEWDNKWGIVYRCDSSGTVYTIPDIRKTDRVKLLWRIDWPMRWSYFDVTAEASGKDHFSKGGSFESGGCISREVFDRDAPFGFQFDFVGIKGISGKMSSSEGMVVTLEDVLQVYQPEVIRYMFVRSRPNSEFVVSFDLDTLKIYEDYDRCARYAHRIDECSEERAEKESCIWKYSQIDESTTKLPYSIPFRHLCNLLQIHDLNIQHLLDHLDIEADDSDFLVSRAQCAKHWLQKYAPPDFVFSLGSVDDVLPTLPPEIHSAVMAFARILEDEADGLVTKRYTELLHRISADCEVPIKQLCVGLYQYLIGRDQGPRLAGFMELLGKEKILTLLQRAE